MICDTTNTDIIMINGSNEQDGILLNMKKKVKNIMIYYHHYTTQIKRSVPLTSVGWDLPLQKINMKMIKSKSMLGEFRN